MLIADRESHAGDWQRLKDVPEVSPPSMSLAESPDAERPMHKPPSDQQVWTRRADLRLHFVMLGGHSVGDIKKSFARAVVEAGLSGITAYCLRSTMATELRTRGVPEWKVGGLLGHKSATARTTERYANFRPSYVGEAVQAIDAFFRSF